MTIVGASWLDSAVCTETDAERLFGRTGAARAARAVCGRCPVAVECLAHALHQPEEFGVWGGLAPYERQVLRHTFPEVTDWYAILTERPQQVIAALERSRSVPRVRLGRRVGEVVAAATLGHAHEGRN